MLTIYDYWGGKNEPPSHLKTKKQLSELGLKSKEPVGVIHCRKYDLYLYDPNNPESCTPKRKPTEKQLAALAQAREAARYKAAYREWYKEFGSLIRAKNEAIQTAKEIASNSDHWLILDTETTGLSNPQIVQIAIINLDGDILLDSLIKPTIPIEAEATAVHGITEQMLLQAPTWKDIYANIEVITKDKEILIYNKLFDSAAIDNSCKAYGLQPLRFYDGSVCLMELYTDFRKSKQWLPLGGNHLAIGDCLKSLEVFRKISGSEVESLKKAFEKNPILDC